VIDRSLFLQAGRTPVMNRSVKEAVEMFQNDNNWVAHGVVRLVVMFVRRSRAEAIQEKVASV
jgi:hypothetical protein